MSGVQMISPTIVGETLMRLKNFARTACTILILLFGHSPSLEAGPLHDAVRAKDVAAIDQALAAGAKIDETDFFLGSALHIAVSDGDTEIAGYLLDRGADPESVGELQGSRPLHIAAELGDVAMVEALLDKGAILDSRDADSRTPLFRAAARGHFDPTNVLLTHGADPNAAEATQGQTPLHRASENGQILIVELLLDQGAPVDTIDGNGFSPLMLAAQPQSYSNVGDGRLLELLVARGADLGEMNAHGQTPREYATMRSEGVWGQIAVDLKRLEEN